MNWEFEVDQELNESTYQKITESGADACRCYDCKNYVVYRESVFPVEVKQLFEALKVDYKKEVEIMSFGKRDNGLHHIVGWFHFKGKILPDNNSITTSPENNDFTIDFKKVDNNFSISFSKGESLTFFDDKSELIQVEFETFIPWVIDQELETE